MSNVSKEKKVKLTYNGQYFMFQCGLADNDLARRSGFSYSKSLRCWITPFAHTAYKISTLCDLETRQLIQEQFKKEQEKMRKSEKTFSAREFPTAHRNLYPYQKAGIEYILETANVLIADDMGLGKTAQAICACNVLRPLKVLVICPASLKINWAREWIKWSTLDINPTIINYDILKKNSVALHKEKYHVVILDEVHYLKNDKAQRTKEVIGHRKFGRWVIPPIQAERVMALTGTPILNRPIELFPILKHLIPHGFPNKFEYAKRYCNATRNRFGWDFKGASNLQELQEKLRSTIMVRRRKEDVLHDLPKKIRQIIEFDPSNQIKKIIKKEQKCFEFFDKDSGMLSNDEFNEVVKRFSNIKGIQFETISTIRREVAEAKLDMCISHLKEAVESSRKIVCFCYHQDVAKSIFSAFKDEAVMLIGSTTLKNRQKAVDRFQHDEDVTLFIGNIKAAGVGLTLTASSHVVFCELDWVPGNVTQAEDRCHRIGQKNSVLIQHLVLGGSLDYYMAKTIVYKQEVIEKAVDTEISDSLREMLG